MRRRWVSWSRRRFVWTLLPVVALQLAVQFILVHPIQLQPLEIALQAAVILVGLVVLYVGFTWAAEYDRRHPREY